MIISKIKKHILKIVIPLIALSIMFAVLNYQTIISVWADWSETHRLTGLAQNVTEEFQNPTAIEDRFEGELSPKFWKFTTINGAGEVSNDLSWHSAAIIVDHGLTIRHYPDSQFKTETADSHAPAADQYNNVTLVGGSGFQPLPSHDVILRFTSQVDDGFYGSAGVILQPVGTLQKNGLFAKPFDMFGYSITGKESTLKGVQGPLCYLALNWVPVQVDSLQVDPYTLHTYEIRLHWMSKTEWVGSMTVDDAVLCQMSMPPFGPLEVQVWSDNYHLVEQARHWWEIAPSMNVKFQDGGEKQFHLGMIRIFEDMP